MYPGLGALRTLGLDGLYWSSTTHHVNSYAYTLHFNETDVYVSNRDNRTLAFSGCWLSPDVG